MLLITILLSINCNKLFNNKETFEEILTNGVWKFEEQVYIPDISNYAKIGFEYNVFKPDGTVHLYVSSLENITYHLLCKDTIISADSNNSIQLADGQYVYHVFKYGEWWYNDNILYIRNDKYADEIHNTDYFFKIMLINQLYSYNCHDFKREVDTFYSYFNVTEFNKKQIVFENYYKTVHYEYRNDSLIPNGDEYTLYEKTTYINKK